MKCDEGKPNCSRCLKINQTCLYGSMKDTITSKTEDSMQDRPSAIMYDSQKEQAVPAWQLPSPEQAMRFPPAVPEASPRRASNQSNNGLHRINSHSSDHLIGGGSMTDAPQQQAGSPERPRDYATPYSVGSSNDSLFQRSAYQPTFNVAISKWFEMLVGDASLEDGPSGFGAELDNFNTLPPPLDPEGNLLPRTVRGSFDLPGQQGALLASSSPHLLERNPLSLDMASEKLRWQAPETIELLPHEVFIMKNFVERISHWVCISGLPRTQR